MKRPPDILLVFLFLGLLIISPMASYAAHDRTDVDVDLGVGPGSYYYGHPDYYPYYADPYYSKYAAVAPTSYQPVVVNGVTYYVNNGTYYIYTQYGYEAVARPAGATEPIIEQAPVSASEVNDLITVNILNETGGYNTIVLKRSGKGFIGPQGEYYSEFPRVSQLKTIYGK